MQLSMVNDDGVEFFFSSSSQISLFNQLQALRFAAEKLFNGHEPVKGYVLGEIETLNGERFYILKVSSIRKKGGEIWRLGLEVTFE